MCDEPLENYDTGCLENIASIEMIRTPPKCGEMPSDI